jgi:hypothetical protein
LSVEGREIIANLAKAAGLATMISTMRPDIDNVDEYVRNTTARAFSVVASALGIQSLLPFLGVRSRFLSDLFVKLKLFFSNDLLCFFEKQFFVKNIYFCKKEKIYKFMT